MVDHLWIGAREPGRVVGTHRVPHEIHLGYVENLTDGVEVFDPARPAIVIGM
jgi:hypothetical protein